MLPVKTPKAHLGVIIARFQTPYLTEGHKELIRTVYQKHDRLAILIGVANVIPSTKNPLDYTTRSAMIYDFCDNANLSCVQTYPIMDNRSDKNWSKDVDSLLRAYYPHGSIVLYGSRDSFIPHYFGKFAVVELEDVLGSGTEAREEAFHVIKTTEDFRRGVCYATANQYRKNVLCVDVVPVDKGKTFRVLLAKRDADEGLYRFIGGHVDVGRESGETAAKRECREESGLCLSVVEYIGSTPINDWKYKETGDSVFTMFFAAQYTSVAGQAKAQDDIDDVKWFELLTLSKELIVPEHHVLFDMLLDYYLPDTLEVSEETYTITEEPVYDPFYLDSSQ